MSTNGTSAAAPFAVVDDEVRTRTFVLSGRWSDEAGSAFAESGVESLELNYALGYSEPNIEFLEELEELPVRRLLILDRSLEDLSPISRLKHLEELSIQSAAGSVLDLTELPYLKGLAVAWEQVRDSIAGVNAVEDLHLHGFDGDGLSPLGHLGRLRRLELIDAKRLRTLSGIENFPLLEGLKIGNARKLVDLSAVSAAASTLQELKLQVCRAVSTLAGVESLTRLRVLGMSDCGPIESLAPVATLTKLEALYAWGSTKILDGDLSPLTGLPALREIRMMDRREYHPRVRDFPAGAG